MRSLTLKLFEKQFLQSLLTPQEMFSFKSTKTIFEKIIQTTQMSLSDSGVDKLFDLMMVSFKYQLMNCIHPQELFVITENHLDRIVTLCTGEDNLPLEVQSCIDYASQNVLDVYRGMPLWELYEVKQTLLKYLQPCTTKVSLFTSNQLQNSDGSFNIRHKFQIPPRTPKPGVMRYFDKDGTVRSFENFTVPREIRDRKPVDTYLVTRIGQRVSVLGLDIFDPDTKWMKLSTEMFPDQPQQPAESKREDNILDLRSLVVPELDSSFKVQVMLDQRSDFFQQTPRDAPKQQQPIPSKKTSTNHLDRVKQFFNDDQEIPKQQQLDFLD